MFKTRVISAVFLIAFLLVTLIPGGDILFVASIALSLIAYRELMSALKLAGNTKKQEANPKAKNLIGCFTGIELLGYLDIVIYYLLIYFVKDRMWLFVSAFVMLLFFMAVYVLTFPKYEARDIMASYFSLLYGPLMLSFIYLTRSLNYGEYAVWLIFVSSWICDTFAYLSGMLLGKHKLAPVLSPKKSIEGAIGGVIGAAVFGGLFSYFAIERLYPEKNVTWIFVLITAVGAVIAQIGDLAASGIKRNEGIKDYGRLIPGHGGIMDRFDSVIFTAPMVYALALLLFNYK